MCILNYSHFNKQATKIRELLRLILAFPVFDPASAENSENLKNVFLGILIGNLNNQINKINL
jgi:hypothetical protein